MITRRQEESRPAISGEALAKIAAQRTGVAEEVAQSVLAALVDALQERLLDGDRVSLGDLLDLGVVTEPARVRRDPSGRFSEIAPATTRLDVRPGASLHERLSTKRAAGVMIVMPAENRFGEMLTEHFVKLGWQVQRVVDADSCHALLDGARPFLLVCDHSLATRDELVRRIKTDWRTNPVPVVTLHTRVEDPGSPDSLLVRGDMAVFEPIAVGPFLRSMDQLLAQATEEAAIFERQLRFRIPAKERDIGSAFELGDSFFRDCGFRSDSLIALTTAYREAIRNAQVHGCLREQDRCIDIELLLDCERITISVEDDGDGFDHRAYRAQLDGTEPVELARERQANGGVGGLGIYLMARCVERLSYNDRGNRVTLTRKRSGERGGQRDDKKEGGA